MNEKKKTCSETLMIVSLMHTEVADCVNEVDLESEIQVGMCRVQTTSEVNKNNEQIQLCE